MGGYCSNNNTLGTEPNSHLAYDLGSELHHPTISMIGGHEDQLETYLMPPVRLKRAVSRVFSSRDPERELSAKSVGSSTNKSEESEQRAPTTIQQRSVQRSKVAAVKPSPVASSVGDGTRNIFDWALVAAYPPKVGRFDASKRGAPTKRVSMRKAATQLTGR